MRGQVVAVSLSERRGVSKHPVEAIELRADWGVVGDAHAGPWHRQVALLAWEDVLEAQARGLKVGAGSFAENLATRGLTLMTLPVGTRLQIGGACLEITQIGKPHDEPDVIHKLVGDSVHIKFHSHETAGNGITCYLAALEAAPDKPGRG